MKLFSVLSFFTLMVCLPPVANGQQAADTTMTARINHIAVYVFDLQKARLLRKRSTSKKIEEPFKDGLHEWFSIGGGAQMHLIQGAKEIIEHVQNTHICFSVTSVDKFLLNFKKHNLPYVNAKGEPNVVTTRVDGVKQIYFKDPDGYWIEINDAK